jgi:hypothetical protein
LSALGSAQALVDSARRVETVRTSPATPRLHSKQVRRVIELAFMGVVAEWEEFLEQTLVRYMCGAKATGGVPTLRLGRCKSIQHAYQLISADPDYDPLKKYINLSSPEQVRKKVGMYLERGGTYSAPLTKYNEALLYAVKIRNRVAHSSSMANKKFIETAKTLLGSNRLRQGFRVGDLLLEAPRNVANIPQSFPNYFESLMEMFKEIANSIAP